MGAVRILSFMETTEPGSVLEEPWYVLVAKVRVDAFNHEALLGQLRAAQASGRKHIGIDLRATRFLSLQAIKFITQFAAELAASGGQLALVAPAEKTKRHFEIYGSLDRILVFRAGEKLNIELQEDLSAKGADDAAAIAAPIAADVSVILTDALNDSEQS